MSNLKNSLNVLFVMVVRAVENIKVVIKAKYYLDNFALSTQNEVTYRGVKWEG
jgi:hypothetical protein